MVSARQALVSGRIEWQFDMPQRGRVLSHVSRFARNGDFIFENRGDQDGWTIFGEDDRGTFRFPQLYLKNRDLIARFQETGTDVTCWNPSKLEDPANSSALEEALDVRVAGLLPYDHNLKFGAGPAAVLNDSVLEQAKWSDERSGDVHIVTAHLAPGFGRIIWRIAADKGWNPVCVTWEDDDGKVRLESRSTLSAPRGCLAARKRHLSDGW